MPAHLGVEPLEPREVPAAFGTPWADRNLTLSFAPDGTPVLGAPSDLDTTLGPTARLAVLRAFQAWATHAQLNVGLVPDAGSAFGAGGGQDDPRFGDVRVGGRELAPDVLAVTAPPRPGDPSAGDVLVNTAAGFGPGGYDLFTAVLQEAGHALGAGNSPDPASAMFEYYGAPRSGLSAADVAAVRALYGERQPDAHEGPGGNGTVATAARYAGPLTADLTTAADVDVFAFTADPAADGATTVTLRAAGLSLVAARVEVLDAAGRVLAARAAHDPTRNDVSVSVAALRLGEPYFVRVTAARPDEFAVGAYELAVSQSALASDGDMLVVADARASAVRPAAEPDAPPPTDAALAGALPPGAATEQTFELAQSNRVRFVLTAAGGAEAVVRDATGREVGRVAAAAGGWAALDVFLPAGAYAVRVAGEVEGAFRLGTAVVTDPIGVRPRDPRVALAPAPAPALTTTRPSVVTSPALAAPVPTAPAPTPTAPVAPSQPKPVTQAPTAGKLKIKPVDPLGYAWWY